VSCLSLFSVEFLLTVSFLLGNGLANILQDSNAQILVFLWQVGRFNYIRFSTKVWSYTQIQLYVSIFHQFIKCLSCWLKILWRQSQMFGWQDLICSDRLVTVSRYYWNLF